MAEVLRMPEVLAGSSEAAIQTWLVSTGAQFAIDQPLAEIETDKAVVELTAEAAGTVGRLLIPEGSSVAVGDAIAVLLDPGEGDEGIEAALAKAGIGSPDPVSEPAPVVAAARSAEPSAAASSTSVEKAMQVPTQVSESADTSTSSAPDTSQQRRFTSPLVRKLAAQRDVDLSDVEGTGPNRRITRRDLENHLAAAALLAPHASSPSSAPTTKPTSDERVAPVQASGDHYEDLPLSRMRRVIARRLTESKSTVPHFYLTADCRVEALLALRAQINESAARKISVNDFVLKAAAGALVEVPEANAIWNVDSIRRFSRVDISVAVSTDGGLVTPVVRDAARMPLSELSAAIADLAQRGRDGRLQPQEMEGGSLSVSNLGMYGTTQFSAILNPPQAGILAIGAARSAPAVGPDGALEVAKLMTVTLSADHRVLDGAVAARLLSAFQARVENPLSILI